MGFWMTVLAVMVGMFFFVYLNALRIKHGKYNKCGFCDFSCRTKEEIQRHLLECKSHPLVIENAHLREREASRKPITNGHINGGRPPASDAEMIRVVSLRLMDALDTRPGTVTRDLERIAQRLEKLDAPAA